MNTTLVLAALAAGAYVVLKQTARPEVYDLPPTPLTTTEAAPGRRLQTLINQTNIQLEQAAADQRITPAAPGSSTAVLFPAVTHTDYPAEDLRQLFPSLRETGFVGEHTQEALTNLAVLVSEADMTDYAQSSAGSWVEMMGLLPVMSLDAEGMSTSERIEIVGLLKSYLDRMQHYPRPSSTVSSAQFRAQWGLYLLFGKLLNQR